MHYEGDNLGVVKAEPLLQQVYQHDAIVVNVSALPFTVSVPPMPIEGHGDSAFPLWPDEGVAALAVKLLDYSLPGLLTGTERGWEWEVEGEDIHGED